MSFLRLADCGEHRLKGRPPAVGGVVAGRRLKGFRRLDLPQAGKRGQRRRLKSYSRNLRISCNLCGVFSSRGIKRDSADLEGYYRTDDVRIDGKRLHLSPLVQDNEIAVPALECDLSRSHEGVVGLETGRSRRLPQSLFGRLRLELASCHSLPAGRRIAGMGSRRYSR